MSANKKLVQSLISRDEETEKLASMSIEELEVMFKQANAALATSLGIQAAGGLIGYTQGRAQKARGEAHTFGAPQVAGALLLPGGVGYQVGRAIGHDSDIGKTKKRKTASAFEMADAWGRELAKMAFMQKEALGEKTLARGVAKAKELGKTLKGKGRVLRGLKKAEDKAFHDPTTRWGTSRKMGTGQRVSEVRSDPEIRKMYDTDERKQYLKKVESIADSHAGARKAIRSAVVKKASVEKIAISFNKVNEASKFVGRISRLVEKHGPAVKQMAGKAGKAVHEGVKNVGTRMGNIKDPIVKGMATGGAIGGVGGAAQGFLDPKENPYTGEKQRLRTAFRKGMAGAAGGMVSGALIGSMGTGATKTAALPGLGGIGSMAKNFVGSMKPVAQKAMSSALPHVAKGMNAIHGSSMGKSVGMGAAGGAALGAAKGLIAPGTDANGKQKSRLGAMAGGAVKGGLVGAGTGAAAKAGVTHLATRAGVTQAPKLLTA